MQILLHDYRKTGEMYQVDAFNDQPFGGNPAAVVFEHKEESWMQAVAAENNLAETAFVSSRLGTINEFDLRW
jgi:PhzF family phenazine biosynthesis protein